MQLRSYVRYMLLCCVAALVSAATLNFVVDPYGAHRLIDVDGFNRLKPKSGPHGQAVKPYRVLEVRPRTLLLGNSRVEVGINPQSPLWPPSDLPVYNMALPGTGVDTSLRSLQHVNSSSKVDLVIMGVDFLDFLSSERPGESRSVASAQPSELDKRLPLTTNGALDQQRWFQMLRDRTNEILSLTALADSLYTVAGQRWPDQADLTALGFNPLHEYRRLVRVEGHEVLFRQAETEYLRNYLRTKSSLYSPGMESSDALDQLRKIIAICRAQNIRLVLYIHPYHAHMLENYRILGIWPLFEEWKRSLVRVVEEAPQSGSGKVELWDFSGYSQFTTESVPGPAERGRRMQWYWEAGHYKQELGDLVLARVLGANHGVGPAFAGFGVKMSAGNIDAQLEAIREGRRQYAEAHPVDLGVIEKRAQSIRAQLVPNKAIDPFVQ